MQRATICIDDLNIRAIVGINEWERKKKQDLVINVRFDYDAAAAIRSDTLADTVDYKKMKRDIIDFVEQSEFFLLEKLCAAVLNIVCKPEPVLSATVRIDKPNALRYARSVAVEMSRSCRSGQSQEPR